MLTIPFVVFNLLDVSGVWSEGTLLYRITRDGLKQVEGHLAPNSRFYTLSQKNTGLKRLPEAAARAPAEMPPKLKTEFLKAASKI
jgi:hypothetical protein